MAEINDLIVVENLKKYFKIGNGLFKSLTLV